MPKLGPVEYAIPFFILAIIAEMLWARRKRPDAYEPRDTLTSLALGTGSTAVGGLTRRWSSPRWSGFMSIGSRRSALLGRRGSPASCSTTSPTTGRTASAHRVRWFWASHVNHHSSQHYNLSTALRQTWTGFIAGRLRVPAAAGAARLPARR